MCPVSLTDSVIRFGETLLPFGGTVCTLQTMTESLSFAGTFPQGIPCGSTRETSVGTSDDSLHTRKGDNVNSNRGLQTWHTRLPLLGVTAGDILDAKAQYSAQRTHRDGASMRRDAYGKLWTRVSDIATPFCILDETNVRLLYPGVATLPTNGDWTPSRILLRGTT